MRLKSFGRRRAEEEPSVAASGDMMQRKGSGGLRTRSC